MFEMRDETRHAGDDATRVMRVGREESCVQALLERLGRRRRDVTIVDIAIDVSGSVGQEVVDQLFPGGIKGVLAQVARNSSRLVMQTVVRVTVFSTEVREVIGWMPVEDALERVDSLSASSFGITRLDRAFDDAISAVTSMKLAVDEARARGELASRRRGSVVLVLTDGCITDDAGHAIPFPSELAERISGLQEERKMSFLAIGVGDSEPEQLAAMAPPSVVKGEPVSHALHYTGDPEDLDWRVVCHFIAEGSSGDRQEFSKEAVMDYEGFELVF